MGSTQYLVLLGFSAIVGAGNIYCDRGNHWAYVLPEYEPLDTDINRDHNDLDGSRDQPMSAQGFKMDTQFRNHYKACSDNWDACHSRNIFSKEWAFC